MALSLGSRKEHEVVGRHHDSEMRPRECEVSSLDVSLHFLELCIRTQTSTSWMIRSAQWMQESAGTCLNSEFAPVLHHYFFPGTCRDQGRELRKVFVLQETQLPLPWCSSLYSLPSIEDPS